MVTAMGRFMSISITIKAKAFKSGYVASDTVSATYTIAERVAMPTSTSTPGYRTTLVDLASTVPGAVIRYTVDGSDPTEQSEVYTAGTAINVTNATGATTIKARVYAEGYRPSEVFTYDYYVKQFFGPTNGANAAVWANTDYTVRLQLDLTNKTYTVSVVDKGTRTPLSAEGRKRFAFATPDSSAVTQVGFVGEGSVTSINGKYTNATGVSVTLR